MDQTMTPQDAFKEALKLARSQAGLAAIVGKRQPAISKRLAGSCRAEADEVLAIETALGVSRHLLRPDIYPRTVPTGVEAPASRVAFDPSVIPNGKAA
jgi:DNA-binding transcriptional regulator YdaS (Cro superfamily)